MKQYISEIEAKEFLSTMPVLEYPNQVANVIEYPMIRPKFDSAKGREIPTAGPAKLVGEAVGYFGKEPKRIIDIGAGAGANALYLAYNGHYVTALDNDKTLVDMSMDRAQFLGIPRKNFTAKQGDLRNITASDKYEGVISTFTLHFVQEHEAKKAVKVFHDMTVSEGLNIVSVYTEDNPQQEQTVREVKYFFKPGELSRLYMNGWRKIRDIEGYSGNYVNRRHFINEEKVLIPTVAEIIAKKGESFEAKVLRITGREVGYWEKADPEYLDTLAMIHG